MAFVAETLHFFYAQFTLCCQLETGGMKRTPGTSAQHEVDRHGSHGRQAVGTVFSFHKGCWSSQTYFLLTFCFFGNQYNQSQIEDFLNYEENGPFDATHGRSWYYKMGS